MERLDKYLSNNTEFSRKETKIQLKKGLVTVNGYIVKDGSIKVSNSDSIMLNGQAIEYKKYVYYMLNKPKGVLSATTDKNKPTVVDIVSDKYGRNDVFPVGRLDKDTTGLLILTNDGEFAHNVISPKKHVQKEYFVELDCNIDESVADLFFKGVTLADGTECLPAILKINKNNKNTCFVTIEEGKYHQIKRMFGAVGLKVCNLERLRIGNLSLDTTLKYGEIRELLPKEIENVFCNT